MILIQLDEDLFVGGQPDEADLRALAQRGVRAVVNMRIAGEPGVWANEAQAAEALGLDYVAFPTSAAEAVAPAHAAKLTALLERLPKPLLLHCASSNRVGAILALQAAISGEPEAVALARGARAGLGSLQETTRAAIAAVLESQN